MLLAPKTKGEGDDLVPDIIETYRDALKLEWQDMLGYALAALAVALLWSVIVGRRRAQAPWAGERWLRLVLVVGLIGLGLYSALDNATCFDDAYISLRYAENFVAGKGLVFNEGEYVEGYTNFLWVMLISLFMVITPFEAPLIATVGSLIAYGLNLWVIWRISLKIAPPFHERALAFPIALALVAVQNTFTDYGTTGLETAFASLMVDLGVLALIRADDAKHTFWAGFAWIMATLTRPDHALFYAVGSGVVFLVWVRPAWRARKSGLRAIWQAGIKPMATYAAPFLIWVLYSAWKLHYYGELLPNTYYAKSAYLTYYKQGLVYATDFHLSSHLWIVLALLVLLWPWFRPTNVPARRFALYAVPAVVLYEWYVIRVGGDFMEGRFYVTLIPLILLSAEQLIHELSLGRARRKALREHLRARWQAGPEAEPEPVPPATRNPLTIPAMLVIGCVAATAFGVRLIPARQSYWHLTDEANYYPIIRWFPMAIDHPNYRVGIKLGQLQESLEAQGVPPEHQPILASGAIGLLGYYSHMPLIDRLGLTDATVAHQEIKKRGRPGHEKWATSEYIRERGVHFRRGGGYTNWFKTYGAIRWGNRLGGSAWWVLIYDRVLMEAIREADPDIWFHDFEVYIDKYIARLPSTDPKRARREFNLFKIYYFDHNDDPERREAFSTYFKWVSQGHKPSELSKDGRWDVYKQRAVEAGKRERELRTERANRQRLAQQWSIPWRNPMLRRQYAVDADADAIERPVPKQPSPRKGKSLGEVEVLDDGAADEAEAEVPEPDDSEPQEPEEPEEEDAG